MIGFLRQYDLLNEFKLNIEVNHATLAGHTFQHELVEAMLVILEAGGFAGGGINFDAKIRRNSTDPADLFYAHIGGMDAFARALIVAEQVLEKSDYRSFRLARYASFNSGAGKDFASGKLSLDELRSYAIEHGEPAVISGRQEYLENLVNRFV